jgi:hypothetical protein
VDTVDFADELVCNATALEFEVATLASCFAATSFFGDNRNFSHPHYGYLMASMGQLDVMSQCWNGPREPKGGQTARMRSFMREYLDDRKLEEHRIAVQLLRHTTMHTGALRPIYDPTTDCAYTWRIHFGNTFPSDVHHYSVTPLPSAEQNYVLDAMSAATSWAPTAVKAFNLQLTTFVTDIRRAAERYTSDMTRRSELKGKCQGVLAGICFQEVKLRACQQPQCGGAAFKVPGAQKVSSGTGSFGLKAPTYVNIYECADCGAVFTAPAYRA